jgi:hypothetical protein
MVQNGESIVQNSESDETHHCDWIDEPDERPDHKHAELLFLGGLNSENYLRKKFAQAFPVRKYVPKRRDVNRRLFFP